MIEQFVPPTPEWFSQNKDNADIVKDAKSNIIYARRNDNRIIVYLRNQNILDDIHVQYAMTYEDMRYCFHRKLSNYRNRIYSAEHIGSDFSDGVFETMFLRVCRKIMGKTEQRIKFAIDSEATQAHTAMAWEYRHEITEAFDSLIAAIDEVRKEFKKAV